MGVELSQHKNILTRMEDMLEQLKKHEHNISLCAQVDSFWYLQKIEEIKFMQSQVNEASERFRMLRLQLHNESHKVYHNIKSDSLIIKRLNRKTYKRTELVRALGGNSV